MIDKLKAIQESFVILQEEENEIQSKELKTNEDIRDLEAIKKLREELVEQLDIVATELSKKQNVEVQEQENKLTKNKRRLEEIEYASKKLYPKLEGKDKTRKKEILESLGFISTLGFDGREVFIDRNLVGEYYDLVKETKPLVEEQKRKYFESRDKKEKSNSITNITLNSLEKEEQTNLESEESLIIHEEISLEERITEIEKKIEKFLSERDLPNQGKKDAITYKGDKYWIPRKRKGEFKTLMTQLNSLKKKQREQETINLESNSTIDDYLNGIVSDSIAAATQTPESQPENGQNQNVPTQLEGTDNSSSSDKEADDLVSRIMAGVQNQIQSNQTGVSTPSEETEIPWTTQETQESEEQNVEQENEVEITGVRKPKVVEKIKYWFKSNKEKVKKAIVGVVIAGLTIASALGLKGCAPKTETPTQEPNEPDTSYADDELIDEMASNPNQIAIDLMEENPYLEHQTEQMMEELGFEKELIGPEISEDTVEENDYSETYSEGEKDILIGSSVIVDEATPIYATATDSIFKTNAYRPYYDNNIERVTLGVSIEYNGKIINVLANTENYNQTIKNMLNDGGKIVSVLTANKENVPVNFDGTTTLTATQLNEMAEGFYPAENINLNNTYERGMSR